MENRAVTLMELLDSREARVNHQRKLLECYGGTLVSITLNIPGPVKDREQYRWALDEALGRMEKMIRDEGIEIFHLEKRFLVTGAEGYISLDADGLKAKKMAVLAEEMDMLGRIFDIDVMDEKGGYSRSQLNNGPRKCLICDGDAKVCARSQAHKIDELLIKIDEIIERGRRDGK